MAHLFGEYELLARSGLFDAEYYVATNPDVAALSIDPLTHYIEKGANELRDPSRAFDARSYVELCEQRGIQVHNPLLHYIQIGAAEGLLPRPNKDTTSDVPALLLSIDVPQLVGGTVVNPIRGNLEIAGWALARSGMGSIQVSIDGERLMTIGTGIRRSDVQRAFPDWEGALTAGFSTLVPHRSLPHGAHTVSVTLHDKGGHTAKSEFQIAVEEAPDIDGPWALRRRMSPPEIDLMARPLLGKATRPSIAVLLRMSSGAKALERTRATLSSLATQVYPHWRVHIVTRTSKPTALRCALIKRLDELSDRVEMSSHAGAVDKMLATRDATSHLMVVRPGDEFSCDAMLEFAAQTVLHPKADFFYSDDRRVSPTLRKVEAYFKPQWSPDLLLSQNYLGRAWCASTTLLRRVDIRAKELVDSGSYHLALRLTEQAAGIQHVPATLLQLNSECAEDDASERKALESALNRRGLAASVNTGRTRGTFRVRRQVPTNALVSIIIPTCAARGLVRDCVESLRRLTKYRNFEIVAIENIPAHKQAWKDWLRANADRVIHTTEPFNWSRFNNLAVAASRGEFILFLNDDTEVIDPGWLEVLLENAQRPDVGAVGPQLLYPDRRVQHAGMFLAGSGIARHAFRHAAEDDPGYFGLALTQRDVIAVTGACLMTRRETFEALGGFDEGHGIVNNDVDYCLRLWRAGLHTIYTPHTKLIHHELASRAELDDRYDIASFEDKWRNIFAVGDPYFHRRLNKERDDYSFQWEPVEVHCVGHPAIPHALIRRVLIVKLDHIGDCITALPAIRRLKRHFPEAKFCVLTGRASKSVWALEPAVDEVIEFDFFKARSSSGLVDRSEDDWRELRERLAPHRFDLAIDLRKHWETRPVLRYTGARYCAGFDMKGKFPWLDVALEWSEDSALLRKRQHTSADLVNLIDAVAAASEVDRAVIVGSATPMSQVAQDSAPMLRRIFRERVICVHASAGNEMKRWPAQYFSLLIDQLVETEKVNVILVGGPDDAADGVKVLHGIKNRRSVWSLIGKLALGDLPAVIARCALFVGNDSGPKHIAAGLGVPTVGIHSGVVDAREWGPVGSTAVAIDRVMTCAPCYLLKIEDCARGLACLRGLMPADVLRVCQRLLATSSVDAASGRRGALAATSVP